MMEVWPDSIVVIIPKQVAPKIARGSTLPYHYYTHLTNTHSCSPSDSNQRDVTLRNKPLAWRGTKSKPARINYLNE